MAKFTLIPFDTTKAPHITLQGEINDQDDSLFISYKLTGAVADIDLGDGSPVHQRVIKLWEKTCFELFVLNKKGSYMEFNFSPVFEWNAFFFQKKGDPLKEWTKINSLNIDILLSREVFHLIVKIDKSKFPENFFEGTMSAGISSVIKTHKSEMSYWALSHEDTKPNFHHFDSFKYTF